jgi:uncharacterized protein YjiS (DUF1127 family)
MRLMFDHDVLPTRTAAPVRTAAVESLPRVHAEVEDWAMRAALRNGFGGERTTQQESVPLRAAARRSAQTGFGALLAQAIRRGRAALRLFHRRLRHAAALQQLQSLDAAALRDLGLDRSELGSAIAELQGRAASTRRIVLEHERLRLRAGVPADHWVGR